MADQELHQRIIELESRMAFQDQSINDLSDEVARQRREIERLQRQMIDLGQHLRGLQSALQGEADDEPPPPHY